MTRIDFEAQAIIFPVNNWMMPPCSVNVSGFADGQNVVAGP